MVNLVQPQSSSHLVFLCGLEASTEQEFCRHFKESPQEWELRIYGLEDGIKIAIHHNPAYIFLYTATTDQLNHVFSDIAFLRRHFPHINRILVCSNGMYSERLVDAISFDGFLVPDSRIPELISCLDTIGRGLRYVHPDIRRTYVEVPHLPTTVTEHERKILSFIAEGKQNKDIAEELCISPHTVKNHKSKLMAKLDLARTMDLYHYAMRFAGERAPELHTA